MHRSQHVIFLATRNRDKAKELQDVALSGMTLQCAYDQEGPEPEETGISFKENAWIKARFWADQTDLPCLADDSGFCVDALDGAPGVETKRFIADSL